MSNHLQGAFREGGSKVTKRAYNADFRRKQQIFTDSPLLLEIHAFGGRRNCRKPQTFADNQRLSQRTTECGPPP